MVLDPLACDFDSSTAVGQDVPCEGASKTITKAMVEIVKEIAEDPKSPKGEPFCASFLQPHIWEFMVPPWCTESVSEPHFQSRMFGSSASSFGTQTSTGRR